MVYRRFRPAALALLLVPFSLVAQDVAPPATPAPAAAEPAPVQKPAGAHELVGAVPADKGLVVFFREPRIMGATAGMTVRRGDSEVGMLRNGRFFTVTAEPGTHVFGVQGETRDLLKLEVEPGKVYYVKGSLGMGVLAGRPDLSVTDESAFAALSDKLKRDDRDD